MRLKATNFPPYVSICLETRTETQISYIIPVVCRDAPGVILTQNVCRKLCLKTLSMIYTTCISIDVSTAEFSYIRRLHVTGESNRFEVFKKRLERNSVKPLNIRQLPPIDEKRICTKSLKSLQRAIDKTSLDRANAILSKSTNQEVLY